MVREKTLIDKVLSVCLGVIFILTLSFSLTGNIPFFTQTASAASQITIGDKTLSVEFDKDYAGGDYNKVRGTDLDLCIKTCAEDDQCNAYTYNPTGVNYDGKPVCWLKSQANSLSSVSRDLHVATGKVLGFSSNPSLPSDHDEYDLEQLLTYRQCIQCNLEGANLAGKDLTGAWLLESNLKGADLSGADLSGADLGGSDLTGANLEEAIVDHAFFYDVTMPDGSLFDLYKFEENNFGTLGYVYY